MKRLKTDPIDIPYRKTKAPMARQERKGPGREEWWLKKSVRASFDASITHTAIAETVIEPSISLFSTTLGPSVAMFRYPFMLEYIGGSYDYSTQVEFYFTIS
jgi:hypothetical protein